PLVVPPFAANSIIWPANAVPPISFHARHMTSIVGILAQDFEALQRLVDLGPFDVRGFDPSAARSGSHPVNNGGHSVASTLQQRFDTAVGPVAYPADDAVRVGLLLQGAAKVDAL